MKKLLDKLILFVYVDALDFGKLHSLLGRTTFFKTVNFVRTLKNIPGYSFGIQSTLLTGKLPQQHMHWMPYIYLEKKAVEEERVQKLFVPLKYIFPLRFRYKSKIVELMFKTCNNIFHYIAVNRKALLVSSPIEWYEKIYVYPYYYMNQLPFFKKFVEEMKNRGFDVYYVGHDLSRCIKGFINITQNLDKVRHEKLLAFLYIDDVDSIGHRYSTSSEEYLNALLSVDLFLSRMLKTCRDISKDTIVLVFSDHGMCDTTLKINIINMLKPVENFIDFVVIDATMAFIWLKDDSYVDDVTSILRSRLLDRAFLFIPKYNRHKLEVYGVYFKDRQYGDIIIQLKPCITFFPNSYSSTTWLKALHGFWPTEHIQRSFIMLKGSNDYENYVYNVKDVTEIRNLLIELAK